MRCRSADCERRDLVADLAAFVLWWICPFQQHPQHVRGFAP